MGQEHPAPIRLTVLGHPIDLSVRNAESHQQVAAAWARCGRGESQLQGASMLAVDSDRPLTPGMREQLMFRLTDAGIGALSGQAIMLHAAGLANDLGDVIGLVAESGTGKSVAAANLCASSFGYVTDETLAVLADGQVVPFAKPIAINVPGRAEKAHISPDALSLRHHSRLPLQLRRLVLLDRDGGHDGAPHVIPVPFGEAMLELVVQTSAFTALEHPMQALALLVQRTRPVRVTYRESGELGPLLHRLLDEPGVPEQWAPVELTDRPECKHVRDAVAVPGGYALLIGDRPLLLTGEAAEVWASPTSGGELVDLLREVGALAPTPAE